MNSMAPAIGRPSLDRVLRPGVRSQDRINFLATVLETAVWLGSGHWCQTITSKRDPETGLMVEAFINILPEERSVLVDVNTIAHGLALLRTNYRQPVVQLRKADHHNGHMGRITPLTADLALQHGLFEWTKYGYSQTF